MKEADTLATSPPRKKMPAEVFVKIWIGEMEVKGTEWEKWVKIEKDSTVTFSFIEVERSIKVEKNENPLPSIVLSSCHIRNFYLTDAQAQSVTIRKNSSAKKFILRNSKTKSFYIQKNSEVGDFLIWEDSKTGGFSISEMSKTGDFFIENSSTTNFWIENATTGKIQIVNSTTRRFWIERSTIGDFLISKHSIIGDLEIVKNSTVADLSVKEESKLARVLVKFSKIQSIKIESKSFVCHLQLNLAPQEPVSFLFKESSLAHLDFEESAFPEFTTLSISDCAVNLLSLKNFCNYGTVFFSGLTPLKSWDEFRRELKFEMLVFNEWKFEFEEMNDRPSTLRLTDSDLGKMQFINCDLGEFDRFEFSNTKMLDVFVAGSQMPGDEAFRLPNDEQDPLKIAEQKRIAYGQFKKIYEARGDVAGSLPYLAYEMEAYLDELNMKSKNWRDHFGERWMLRLNRYSTSYGNNWLLGAKRTFWAIVICYSLFCLSHGFFPGTDVARFLEVASYAPQYLNPFRDADSVIPEAILPELSDWWEKWILPFSRLIDYTSRVIVAYFVYQTIQAFRKLGKSSG